MDDLSFSHPFIMLTAAARELTWRSWDDVYIVYQPSSAETHVFNETSAAVLDCLRETSMTMEGLKVRLARDLGVAAEDLVHDDLAFAVGRLDELGLVEWSHGTAHGS